MNIKNLFLNLIFPKRCFSCSFPGEYLCDPCLKKLKPVEFLCCPGCFKKNLSGELCKNCLSIFYFSQLIFCFDYKNKIIRKLLSSFKYRFIVDICEIISKFISEQFYKFSKENFIVIPIPAFKKRLKYRGFNQSSILAKNFCKSSGFAFCDCLERVGRPYRQVGLDRFSRISNVRGTIKLKREFFENISGKNCLLIDDVATTCSILNESARMLKEAGAKKICCLVLARSLRWSYENRN